MATLTMKKSRTIMKVPVSITASGAHVRCAGPGSAAAWSRAAERVLTRHAPTLGGRARLGRLPGR